MADEPLKLDPSRCALIIQDLQNDVIIEGGAFAESGSPEHAKEQNVVENVKALAETARAKGIPVIHVHYIVEEGAPGLKLNAPLFKRREGHRRARARLMGRRTGRGAGAAGRRPRGREDADERVARHEPREPARGTGRDTVIVTGAWTNMSIEHTSRTGADKGYYMVVPEDGCSTMNADWHNASINYALQNVAAVTQLRRGDGGARMRLLAVVAGVAAAAALASVLRASLRPRIRARSSRTRMSAFFTPGGARRIGQIVARGV